MFLPESATNNHTEVFESMGCFVFKNKLMKDSVSIMDRMNQYLEKLPHYQNKISHEEESSLRYLRFLSCVRRNTSHAINLSIVVKNFPESFFEISPCYFDHQYFRMFVHPSNLSLDKVASTAMLIFMYMGSRYNIEKRLWHPSKDTRTFRQVAIAEVKS